MATKTATAAVDEHHGGAHPAGNQIKQFDSLRNTLKNAKHSSGHDLYQHLVDVMNHIVTHCPDNGIDKFEEISYLLKLQRDGKIKTLSDFLLISENRAYSTPGKALHGDTEKYLAKAKKLLDVSYNNRIQFLSIFHPSVNLNTCVYRIRRKVLLEVKVLLRVAKMHLPMEEPLALLTTFLTFLLTLESSNGVVSVSAIMKLFS